MHAYIYARVSSDAQLEGSGLERQRTAAEARIAQYLAPGAKVELVEDGGTSAYRSAHLKKGALGRLLAGMKAGTTPPGLFAVESVSRLSRAGGLVLLPLLAQLLDVGCHIVFLDSAEPPFHRDNTPVFWSVRMALYAELAQEESRIKSRYATDNWARRRAAARDEGKVFTSACPGWLEVVNDEYVVRPAQAAAVREVFDLVLQGWGISRIVRHLNAHQRPAPARSGTWHNSRIVRLLVDRAVLGEFQPRTKVDGVQRALGEPWPGYYPAIVEQAVFDAVRVVQARREKLPARNDANNYNYMQGLASCACGSSWRRLAKHSGPRAGYARYSCAARVRGATQCPSLPAATFDTAFISFACDTLPSLLASKSLDTTTPRLALEARLADIAAQRQRIVAAVAAAPDLSADFVSKLRELRDEEARARLDLKDLDARGAPADGLSFREGLEAYVPAFLHVHEGDLADAAFKLRAEFRARVLEAVERVVVASDRRSAAVYLRNGVEAVIELDVEAEWGPGEPGEDIVLGARSAAGMLRRAR